MTTLPVPSVGRIVHYYHPARGEGAVVVGPCAALVTLVHEIKNDDDGSEFTLNLAAFLPSGAQLPVNDIPLLPAGSKSPEFGGWAEWPPRV